MHLFKAKMPFVVFLFDFCGTTIPEYIGDGHNKKRHVADGNPLDVLLPSNPDYHHSLKLHSDVAFAAI